MQQKRNVLPYIILLVFLFLYLYRVIETIDYPNWDETYYMRRGLAVVQGNAHIAGLSSISSSPLMPLVYAGLYTFIRSSNLYPYAVILTVVLLTASCFLLLRKFLAPTLAAALTMLCIVSALPAKFENISYYFGTALLWMGLAMLGKSPISRGIGLLVVTAGLYVRPEFIFTVAFLIVALLIYEVRQFKANRTHAAFTLVAYLPALILIVWTIFIATIASPNDSSRTRISIPWSYFAFYSVTEGTQAAQEFSNNYFALYERDFGSTETVASQLKAMLNNPLQAAKYLGFDTYWIPAVYASSFLSGWSWNYGGYWSSLPPLPIVILFWTAISALIVYAARLYRKHKLTLSIPVLGIIGLTSLLTLIPSLILVHPNYRAFMTFPLLLVPLGYALTIVFQHWKLSHRAGIVAIIVLLLLTPRPFDTVPQNYLKRELERIKRTGASCKVPGWGETFENLAALDGYVCTH